MTALRKMYFIVVSNSSPRKYFEESNHVSATVSASGRCALIEARHSRQNWSLTHGATSMRQPAVPWSSHVFITESGLRKAKSLKLSDSVSSGIDGPPQPEYWLSGWVLSGEKGGPRASRG